MPGVTILSEQTYRELSLGGLILVCILSSFVIYVCMWDLLKSYRRHHWKKNKITFIVDVFHTIVLAVVGIVVAWFGYWSYDTVYIDYKIKVDDTVTFNEFMDYYEIVSYNGDTYTVREINK